MLVPVIDHTEVCHNLDTVRNEVVKCHTGCETFHLLAYDRTCLVVETCRYTEVGLITTTGHRHVVSLLDTEFPYLIYPVGVVIIHLVLREVRVIVKLDDIGCGVTQFRIKE